MSESPKRGNDISNPAPDTPAMPTQDVGTPDPHDTANPQNVPDPEDDAPPLYREND